ncbi:DUF6588 family protein [Psychroflexus aestuariivivens]|uniref:DUF6588 family protein n=1 Tax=Psychroflexus aestuariivivens TaxID=1795040 RepID=UPI000FDA477E|nr:DUF6588 family protein [Psychroflexus aestuariivivens]
MKKIIFVLGMVLFSQIGYSQTGVNDLLAAGLEDAQQFSQSYFSPSTEAMIYSLSSGWYNSGEAKKLGEFEVSFTGNASMIGDSSRSFELNTADYNFLEFQSGPSSQMVATSLGQNNPNIDMNIVFQDENGNQEEVMLRLPQGIGSEGVSTLPSAFVQANVGLVAGFEVKFRFLPEVNTEDVDLKMYGFGLQNEFSKWIPGVKSLPVAISGIIGYSKIDGRYALDPDNLVQGSNQRIESDLDSWLYSLVASTKFKVINFYGGIGYVNGSSETSLLGNYTINEGVIAGQTLENPFSVKSDISGMKATLGTRLKLSFFRIHVDYSFQEFNTVSGGISFGI